MEDWVKQLQNQVNTLEKLKRYINVTPDEEKAIRTLKTKWGITPYFASLMDPNDENCPIRKQIVPSMKEMENRFGIPNYLVWKENRVTDEKRPDTIARQYDDRIAFTITNVCAGYCRFCFRRELTVKQELRLKFDVEDGLKWIRDHNEIRDVVLTGGDPLIFPDERIEYLISSLRSIPHIEIIRIHSRIPIYLPQRITPKLVKILKKYHKIPIWLNIHCNHPKEITDLTAKAVFRLLSCGINVGNQSVLLKGINDDPVTFKKLNQKLLSIRVRPYYLFYCEPAPGTDHFRTPIEKGAELIRDSIRGHTTGMAQPMYVVATKYGKIPLSPDYYIVNKTDKEYKLRSYKGKLLTFPNIID